jgi:flagellar hook-associated protein 2
MASTIFTGSSTYSQDFMTMIDRTMAIAELPLVQLQQQRLATNDRQTALNEIHGKFESLRLAISDVATRAASTQFIASFSKSGVASATLGEGVERGSFTLEVLDLGSATTYVSANGVPDSASTGLGVETTKTLIVDGVETTLTLTSNSMRALAEAINASNSGISASVINVSSGDTPFYKLILQGNKFGSQTIELRDGDASGANLLEGTALHEGTAVSYKLNGITIEGESRNVHVAQGLDLELTGLSSGPLTVQIGRSASSVSDAIQSMVAAFNLAAGELNKHRGPNAGALSGSIAINTLGQLLRRLHSFTTETGTFRSVVDLGLTFDDKGTLMFDSTKLSGLSDDALEDLLTFLGAADGEGFLDAALKTMQEATNSDYGILTTEKKSLTAQLDSSKKQMEALQERLDRMEQDLRDRFAIVDSTIAALQQQAQYINSMFEAMRIASQAYSR